MGSATELEYCLSGKAKFYPLELTKVAESKFEYIINDIQPYYYVAESFSEAKKQIKEYCDSMIKPFNVYYNEEEQRMVIDRNIKTREERVITLLF